MDIKQNHCTAGPGGHKPGQVYVRCNNALKDTEMKNHKDTKTTKTTKIFSLFVSLWFISVPCDRI